tara:strand:+ start:615 stop:824 length:210 start_codon:yes stop_codon:yes gene_type:complete
MSDRTPVNIHLSAKRIAACKRIAKRLGGLSRVAVIRRAIDMYDRLTKHRGRVLLEDANGNVSELVFEAL